MANKPRITKRQAEKLIRAAYDFEEMAGRFRAAGYEREAYSVKDISSRLGKIGRALLDTLEAAE